jgi:hypothetical protein
MYLPSSGEKCVEVFSQQSPLEQVKSILQPHRLAPPNYVGASSHFHVKLEHMQCPLTEMKDVLCQTRDRTLHTGMYKSIARQRFGKHIPTTHARAIIEHPLLGNGPVNTPP